MEENSIDALLKAYQKTNERLSNTEMLNKKILRELLDMKIRKSLTRLKYYDYLTIVLTAFSLPFSFWMIYACRVKQDLFICSIVAVVLYGIMLYVYFRYYQWSFRPVIYVEKDLKETLERIRIHTLNLHKQRFYSMIIVVPLMIAIVPPVWWGWKGLYYMDVFHWASEKAHWYFYFVGFLLLAGFFFSWKLYDWMYFKNLKKIEDNIRELEE